MAGKTRTVHFFELIEVAQDESVQEYTAEAWDDLFDMIAGMEVEELRHEIRQRKYEGEVRDEPTRQVRYLYLGKLRPGMDWPDIRDLDGEHTSLASTGVVGALIEPAYVVRITGTPFVAILRTPGGPSFTAISSWLTAVAGLEFEETRLELRPYARRDQLARLNSAIGATKLHLKVGADVLDDADPTSDVVRAMQAVQDTGAGGVSVEMIVSYGNARPDGVGAQHLADAVAEFVRTVPGSHASATLMQPQDDGYVKDHVDFTLDRISLSEEVGGSEDEEPTAYAILGAMSQAIRRFREYIEPRG
ncbi:hypothetical protein QE374_003155 [Microbacterium sp. SORGH_AS428]|uniref:hypothetical protein n=1 Tax=Microbacterium sp. SORGH_AS_0428 TaxID=3041788 RepID=UPI00285D55CD|nr:hypothetical protein [Microbacterium sp. SORGH_AS_0428]MDR6201246.1 hypothetical protein [Microbacterium sp. SORGH_AS_0428]